MEARLHFENGVSLLGAAPPNYQDAYRQFLLAYEKSGQNWKVLGNLGLCALGLERDGEALTYYQRYLDEGGDEVSAEERADIEREVLLIKGNMATLRLTASDPGVRVSVEREGSSVPAQLYRLGEAGAEIGVRAGQLTLTASLGDRKETWETVVSAGESANHTFDFTPPAPVAAVPNQATASEPPPPPPQATNPVRTWGFVMAGAGVLTLAGGLVLGIVSQDQATAAEAECIQNVCREETQDKFNAAADLATVSNVLFVAGGVLAASGVTLVIVGAPRKEEPSPTASLSLSPVLGPGFSGLSAVGHF